MKLWTEFIVQFYLDHPSWGALWSDNARVYRCNKPYGLIEKVMVIMRLLIHNTWVSAYVGRAIRPFIIHIYLRIASLRSRLCVAYNQQCNRLESGPGQIKCAGSPWSFKTATTNEMHELDRAIFSRSDVIARKINCRVVVPNGCCPLWPKNQYCV